MPELNDDHEPTWPVEIINADGSKSVFCAKLVRREVGAAHHRCVTLGLYLASVLLGVFGGFLLARLCNLMAWSLGGLL